MPLPQLDRYLATLPAGFDSYPEAFAKATVVQPWRDGVVGAALRACPELPPALRSVIDQPLAVSDWVPEVALSGLIAAALDVHFTGVGGAEALQLYVRTTNRTVMKGPLYSILFAVVSPARLLSGVAQRWSAFHRGSTLLALERESTRAVLEITHPPHLFSPPSRLGHGTSFALAAELAGGRDVRMSMDGSGTTSTRYALTWR